MAMLQVRQVNRQGQISIGKKYSGRKVEISEFELDLLKDKAFQQRLGEFSRWEQENLPAETFVFL